MIVLVSFQRAYLFIKQYLIVYLLIYPVTIGYRFILIQFIALKLFYTIIYNNKNVILKLSWCAKLR